MDGVFQAIIDVPTDGASGPGAVLITAGACMWVLSLLVGWMTPLPLVASLGRAALAASAVSVVVLLTGAVLLVVAAVG